MGRQAPLGRDEQSARTAAGCRQLMGEESGGWRPPLLLWIATRRVGGYCWLRTTRRAVTVEAEIAWDARKLAERNMTWNELAPDETEVVDAYAERWWSIYGKEVDGIN